MWNLKLRILWNPRTVLDIRLELDNEKLYTKLYDKRDDFNFTIVNFPFLDSNIPASPAYGVYISQLIRYARACSYVDFRSWGSVLTRKCCPKRLFTSKSSYNL